MTRWFALGLLCGATLTGPAAAAAPDRPAGTVIGVAEDFAALPAGPFDRGHLESWRWTDDERRKAKTLSRLDVVDGPGGRGKHLRVQVHDAAVLAREPLPVLRVAPFFPPEADAVRVRLQVAAGKVNLFLGGPTAYYANSDVFTDTLAVAADPEPRWVDLDFRLNHPLRRNFRRAGFSTDAPRNYYTRWAQEPLMVYLAAGTAGDFRIDRVELIALGEGRPFPAFAAAKVTPRATAADFEDGRTDRAFTLYMANAETEWFEHSWKRDKPLRFTPATLAVTPDGRGGGKCLTCSGPAAEEVHCAGVRVEGAAAANAIAVAVAADAPGQRNTVVGAGPAVPIDFLAFVAPAGRPFPWARFGPPAEWKKFPGPGFDYHLSYNAVRPLTDVDFAVYQTRRYLTPKEWHDLVLPAADFACVYGAGACRERFLRHEPLACGDVTAVAWLSPWCRVGRRESAVTFRIDDLRFVTVPGTAAEHRSFWQITRPQDVELTDETAGGVRTRRMVLAGGGPK